MLLKTYVRFLKVLVTNSCLLLRKKIDDTVDEIIEAVLRVISYKITNAVR